MGVRGRILRGVAAGITRFAGLALWAGVAAGQPADFTIEVLDRNTPRESIHAPACLAGATIRFHQATGTLNLAEKGAWVAVTGHQDARYNGLYRIIEFAFDRDRDRAIVNTTFVAVCVPR